MARDRRSGRDSPFQRIESGTELERTTFFSDGIFAIAITFLALDIRIPELAGDELATLPAVLLGIWPKFMVYAVGFLVLGSYWLAHHRTYRFIRRYDLRLLWLNISFLLCIGFLPISTGVIVRYHHQQAAAIFYAISVIVTALIGALMWSYATKRNRLVDEDLDPDIIRYLHVRWLISIPVAIVSIAFSFVSPVIAVALWVVLIVVTLRLTDIYSAFSRDDRGTG
jgi:uncharacterized membrane protein